jgi:hypothetical protein
VIFSSNIIEIPKSSRDGP